MPDRVPSSGMGGVSLPLKRLGNGTGPSKFVRRTGLKTVTGDRNPGSEKGEIMKKISEASLYEMMYRPKPKLDFWRGTAIAMALSVVLWGIIAFSAWAVWGQNVGALDGGSSGQTIEHVDENYIWISRDCQLEFMPKKDITAYEVALIFYFWIDIQWGACLNELPPEIQRHFKEVCY